MVNCWFGLVVWDSKDTTNSNQQLSISWLQFQHVYWFFFPVNKIATNVLQVFQAAEVHSALPALVPGPIWFKVKSP